MSEFATTKNFVGQRFKVLKGQADRFFPHDFEVTDETAMSIHLKNQVESYWITRRRFEDSIGKQIELKS